VGTGHRSEGLAATARAPAARSREGEGGHARLATGKLTSKERRIVEFVISQSHPVTQQEISAFMQSSVLDTQSTYYEICKSLCAAGFLGRFLQDGIWHYVGATFSSGRNSGVLMACAICLELQAEWSTVLLRLMKLYAKMPQPDSLLSTKAQLKMAEREARAAKEKLHRHSQLCSLHADVKLSAAKPPK